MSDRATKLAAARWAANEARGALVDAAQDFAAAQDGVAKAILEDRLKEAALLYSQAEAHLRTCFWAPEPREDIPRIPRVRACESFEGVRRFCGACGINRSMHGARQ